MRFRWFGEIGPRDRIAGKLADREAGFLAGAGHLILDRDREFFQMFRGRCIRWTVFVRTGCFVSKIGGAIHWSATVVFLKSCARVGPFRIRSKSENLCRNTSRELVGKAWQLIGEIWTNFSTVLLGLGHRSATAD